MKALWLNFITVLIISIPNVNAQIQSFGRIQTFESLTEIFTDEYQFVEEDYDKGEKWFAFIAGEVFKNKLGMYIDLADYLGISQEGRDDGWVTININADVGFGAGIPISLGFTKTAFQKLDEDNPEKLFECKAGVSLPLYRVELSFENIEEIIEPRIDGSIGAGCSFKVITIEVQKEFIEEFINEFLAASDNSLAFANALLSTIPTNASDLAIFSLDFLQNSRLFATPYDDIRDTQIRFINYDNLEVGQRGEIAVGVIASRNDDYRIKISERGIFDNWTIENQDEYINIEEYRRHIFKIPITPTTEKEIFRVKLQKYVVLSPTSGIPSNELKFDSQFETNFEAHGLEVTGLSYKNQLITVTFNYPIFDFKLDQIVKIFDQNLNEFAYDYAVKENKLFISGIDDSEITIEISNIFSDKGFTLFENYQNSVTQEIELSVDFSSDLNNVTEGESVSFIPTLITGSNEEITYSWDFTGDGVIDSNIENPIFTYQVEGSYPVALTIEQGVNEISLVKPDYINVSSEASSGGTGTLDLYSINPVIEGQKVWLTVYTDPRQEGIPIAFNFDNQTRGTLELINDGITNSSGYANAEFTALNNGSINITASSDGFTSDTESMIIKETQEGGRINFTALYDQGTTTFSKYRLHFEDVQYDWLGENYTVEITNGAIEGEAGKTKSGVLSDEDDLYVSVLIEEAISTGVTLTTLGQEFNFTFTPLILNPKIITPFFVVNGSKLGGFDWSQNTEEFIIMNDELLLSYDTYEWSSRSQQLEGGSNEYGDIILNVGESRIAYIRDNRIFIQDFPSLTNTRTTGDISANPESVIDWLSSSELVAGSYDTYHTIFNSNAGKVRDLELNEGVQIFDNDVNDIENHYAAAYEDLGNEIIIFNTSNWSVIKRLNLDGNDEAQSVSYSADGASLAAASKNGVLEIFDVHSNYESSYILPDVFRNISKIDWNPNPDMNYLAASVTVPGTKEKKLYVYDMNTNERLFTANLPNENHIRLKWSNDGKLLSIGNQNRTWLFSPFDDIAPSLSFKQPIGSFNENKELILSGSVVESSNYASLQFRIDQGNWETIYLDNELQYDTTITVPSGQSLLELKTIDRYLNESIENYSIRNIDFISVSGYTVDPDSVGIPGVNVTLTGGVNTGSQSNDEGFFSYSVPKDSTYTLRFSSNEFRITPDSVDLVDLNSDTLLYINADGISYYLSGHIETDYNKLLGEVSLILESNDGFTVEKVDSLQSFAFQNLAHNNQITVYPISDYYSFVPDKYIVESLEQDIQTDFLAKYKPDTTANINLFIENQPYVYDSSYVTVQIGNMDMVSQLKSINFDIGSFASNQVIFSSVELLNDLIDNSILTPNLESNYVNVNLELKSPLDGVSDLIKIWFKTDLPGKNELAINNLKAINFNNDSLKISADSLKFEVLTPFELVFQESLYDGIIGDTLSFPLYLESQYPTPYSQFKIDLEYDSELVEIVGFGTNSTITHVAENIDFSRRVNLASISGSFIESVQDTGLFINLSAELKKVGNTSIMVSDVQFNDGHPKANGNSSVINIIEVPIVCGDVTDNGSVTSFDATKILKHAVRLERITLQDSIRADVTANGKISSFDASQILKSSVGLIDITDLCGKKLSKEKSNDEVISLDWSYRILDDSKEKITIPIITNDYQGILESVDLEIDLPKDFEFNDFESFDKDWLTVSNIYNEKLLISLVFNSKTKLDTLGYINLTNFKNQPITSKIRASYRINETVSQNFDELSIESLPDEYGLSQNYPNPFNPSTQINYSLPKSTFVKIEVRNILGQLVSTLISEKVEPGNHSVSFDASRLSSGVYFYTIKAGDFGKTLKMLLIK